MLAIKRMPSSALPELDHQLVLADKKIGVGLLHSNHRDELSRPEIRFAESCMLVYGSAALRFAFAPNHSNCGEYADPRGFIVNVSADAPLYATPFPERSMFNGVLAFPLEYGYACNRTAKGLPIPSGYFSHQVVRDSINQKILEDRDLGDDETNYAGIFSTTVREGFDNRVQYWAVVQCHNTDVSKQFHDYLCEQEARHRDVVSEPKAGSDKRSFATWRSFFLGNEKVADFMEQQQEHRARVMVRLLQACGLGPVCDSTDIAENVSFILNCPHTVNVLINNVESIDENTLAYYSDMVSVKTVTDAGVAVREAGRLGIALLRGPLKKPRHPLDIAFPCATGHRKSVRDMSLSEFSSREVEEMKVNEAQFWERAGVDRPLNLNLATTEANVREDKRWAKIEVLLGYSAENGLVDLRPIQVKLHSTVQPSN